MYGFVNDNNLTLLPFIGDGDPVYILKSSNAWVDRIHSRLVLYCIVLY